MTVANPNVFPLAEGIFARIADDIDALVTTGDGAFVTETTPITGELLKFWFHSGYCDVRNANFHVGQRDAILAIVYAHEILGATSLSELYREVCPDGLLDSDVLAAVSGAENAHPKYAAKMATGTGKTWVLNALLIWQYLNAIADPSNPRYSSNFLIVAPGLIVYDRLLDSFQGKMFGASRDYETSDIRTFQELFVPENFRSALFAFLQGSVVTKKDIGRKVTGGGVIAITNWHALAGQEDLDTFDDDDVVDLGGEIDLADLANDILPLGPGANAGNALDVLDRRNSRGEALDFLVDLPSLVVFNDEAHHIHALKRGEEVTEVEWQKSLRKIAQGKSHRFVQVDFSATPYNEIGTGRAAKSKKWFPHIVVDFDLATAMSTGLVKRLALDRRKEIGALPLNFKVDDDGAGNKSLSDGQRTMLRAGLQRLEIIGESFEVIDESKRPKMLIMCEDTSVVPLVEQFLIDEGLVEDEILSVHSGKKADLGATDWEKVRDRLFALDKTANPKVVISVLMLREGFDVNNICVIVPLRASGASILLEQTVGRGLRLMWRGDEAIDDLKRESRQKIDDHKEPDNYYDMLFVVEHPAFIDFYDELMHGAGAIIVDDPGATPRRGGIEKVGLRDGFEKYDFEIPIVIRDPEEELREPVVDISTLKVSKYDLSFLIDRLGKGDRFSAHDVPTKVQFGDYRVDGGVMTATGYNDFLSRLANRIVTAHSRAFVATTSQMHQAEAFPILQSYQRLVIGWLDTYIRTRYFNAEFNPMDGENWRVLLLEQAAEEIAGEFGRVLVEIQENIPVGGAEVMYRYASEVDSITVRTEYAVDATKCIFAKQPYPSNSGGLERDFMTWVDSDAQVDAFLKIDVYKHDFLRRPYLKTDGMPAQYSPDFLVRCDDRVYLVETKAQTALSDGNVIRKKKSAVSWVASINALEPELRDNKEWFYVLAGESSIRNYMNGGESACNYLASVAMVNRVAEETDGLF